MSRLVTACVLLAMGAPAVLGCGGAPQVEMLPGEALELAYKEIEDLTYKGKSFQTTNYKGFARDSMTEYEFVTSVDSIKVDGSITRIVQFDKYSLVTYSGGRAIFDPEAKMIEGESLWLKVDPTGKIIDWRGLEGVRSYNAEDRNQKETIVHGIALSFLTLPSEPVGVGHEWTQTVEMPITMTQGRLNFSVTNTYTLLGVADKNGHRCARVELNSAVVGAGRGDDEARDYHFTIDVEGEGKGEIYFSIEGGFLVFSHEEVDIETEHTSVRGREEAKTEFFSAKVESEVVLVE